MTTPDIIAALANCNHTELMQVREDLDARVTELRTAFMAQAAEMGLACSENGKPKRKRRPNAGKDAD